MLKSEVSVNGLVIRDAVAKTNSEGKSFVTFGLRVDMPYVTDLRTVLDISVSRDGEDVAGIVQNARVEVNGTLSFKKRGEKTYLNLHATEINLCPASTTDMITGTLSFRGTLGKSIESKTGKNGKPYLLFSGYSCEKVDEGFEYTWVRFVYFGENESIKPQAKVEATGTLELSTYKEKLNISCRLSEIKEWIRQPQAPETSGDNDLPATDACPL